MTGVGIRLTGLDRARGAVTRALRQTEHPRVLYDAIGGSLVASTQQRFLRGIGPDGSPWPPSVRALAEGGKTLIDTARLMQSVTADASDAAVEVGSNAVYAAIHQLGGVIQQGARQQVIHFKRNARTGRTRFARANKKATYAQKVEVGPRSINMPARPFLGVDDRDETEIEALVGDWLLGPQGANDAG